MFTSRLPKSTSVRKPSLHGETSSTSTSFVGLNRPSAIPTTVRKANLFTPQTKRPFSSGASTAGKSYMTTDKKYQRPLKPLPDKDHQIRMFDKLVDFLKTNAPQMPVPEAKKFFSSVSTTESARIFQLLISCFLPEFKMTRLETDVPEALTLLGYPYIRSVTKSALVSVTTRQAAVGLLVIFEWLIDQYECANGDYELEEDDEPNEGGEIYKYILRNPGQIDDAAKGAFENLYPAEKEGAQSIADEIERNNVEYEQLSKKVDAIEDATQSLRDLDHDIPVCKQHNADLEKYLQTKLDEEEEQKQHSSEFDMLEEELARREAILHQEIRNHPLDKNEVRNMSAHREELQAKIMILSQQGDEIQSKTQQNNKTYQTKLSTLREANDINLTSMKKLLKIYESHSDLGSEHLAERIAELREWIIRLEQAPHDNLTQTEKLMHEHMLFMQKLEATDSLVDKELKASVSEETMQLDNVRSMKERYSREIIPQLGTSIINLRRDTEEEKLKVLNSQSIEEARSEEDAKKLVYVRKKFEDTMATLLKESALESQLLKARRGATFSLEDDSSTYLKSLIEATTQQMQHMVREAESRVKRLRERRAIAEENNRIAKKGFKMIKKRLSA